MLARVRQLLGGWLDRIAARINVEPKWAGAWDDDPAEEFDTRQARDHGRA